MLPLVHSVGLQWLNRRKMFELKVNTQVKAFSQWYLLEWVLFQWTFNYHLFEINFWILNFEFLECAWYQTAKGAARRDLIPNWAALFEGLICPFSTHSFIRFCDWVWLYFFIRPIRINKCYGWKYGECGFLLPHLWWGCANSIGIGFWIPWAPLQDWSPWSRGSSYHSP